MKVYMQRKQLQVREAELDSRTKTLDEERNKVECWKLEVMKEHEKLQRLQHQLSRAQVSTFLHFSVFSSL